jgi:hypothetical protein
MAIQDLKMCFITAFLQKPEQQWQTEQPMILDTCFISVGTNKENEACWHEWHRRGWVETDVLCGGSERIVEAGLFIRSQTCRHELTQQSLRKRDRGFQTAILRT